MSLLDLDFGLVVNTAGPFQGKTKRKNLLLGECIRSGIPYIDVCNDFDTAKRAKSDYHKAAIESNVPVILSTGC